MLNRWEVIARIYTAIADHSDAIRINPETPALSNNRGLVYQSNGEAAKAIALGFSPN